MEILVWFILATAVVFEITCISIVFAKAEKPGWGAIIPIYGIMLLCDIAGKPRWWTLLCLIPLVNIYAFAILGIGVARHFDRSDAFGVGLALVPVVFWAVLAFGDAEYDTYDSTEQTVPVRNAASAPPAPPPVSRPQRAAVPAPVRRPVPVSALPVEGTNPQPGAPPSLAERAVLTPAAPVPVTPLRCEATPPLSGMAASASPVANREEEAPAVHERTVPVSAVPAALAHLKPAVAPPGDSAADRPQIARCPSCRKVRVGVVEEAGIRRCASCLAALPNYIQVR
ncbi:MAG: DUF5684 domain-containing protein [Dehalococcoidia bacterium]|nr:DUF5684 domain-containing protein [Dehalococcoidia bacterium]